MHEPGGDGGGAQDELSRSDLAAVQQALRQDWALSAGAKKELLQTLVNIAANSRFDRNKIAAAKAIALLMRLNIAQGALDLARQKLNGNGGKWSLAELVAEAEQIAETHVPAAPPAEAQPK